MQSPNLRDVVLVLMVIPELPEESKSGPLNTWFPQPGSAGPCPAVHTQFPPQWLQDAMQKEDPQEQRGRRRQAHAWSLAGSTLQNRARVRSPKALRQHTERPTAEQPPSCQANAGSYSNHQSAAGLPEWRAAIGPMADGADPAHKSCALVCCFLVSERSRTCRSPCAI